jgi:hypothetical protein
MDRAEAYTIARDELASIECAGYGVASEHIDTIVLKDVSANSGSLYEVELSYLWKDQACEEILVICRVTSKKKDWFGHKQVEESIILCSPST